MIDLVALEHGAVADEDIEDELAHGCREASLGFAALGSLREPEDATAEARAGLQMARP